MNIRIIGAEIDSPDHLIAKEKADFIGEIVTFKLDLVRGESSETKKINKKEYDLTELEFEDGSTWISPPDDLLDMFDQEVNRDASSGDFVLPSQVHISNTRGLSDVIKLKAISFFKLKAAKTIASVAAVKIDKFKVSEPGLYTVSESFELKPFLLKNVTKDHTYILFIHGTLSSTLGSFSDLKEGLDIWKDLHSKYPKRILAYEHHTLSKNPLENARELLEQLPNNINLHLVTHSRGGIIGDILAKCDQTHDGFSHMDIELLESEINSKGKKVRENELIQIQKIENIRKEKSYQISNFIRVACPAAGTSILSGRIDIFLNVFNNLLKYTTKANPIAGEVGSLILNIIKQKSNPESIPGLEAMMPESIFQQMMNNHMIKIESPLSIVYSNSLLKGGILKGLAYILSRFIFGRDNDFVVDLNSMFFGVPRKQPLRGLEIIDKTVCHTNYFSMNVLRDSLVAELSKNYATSKFSIKNISEADRGIAGIPGGRLQFKKPSGKKPIVILIPGIMGSVLSRKKDVLWLDYQGLARNGIAQLSLNGNENGEIKATHLIKSAYEKLKDHLNDNGYDVLCIPYDWRKSLKDEGAKLKMEIVELLNMEVIQGNGIKKKFNQPIKILAHSMGGLLVRDLMHNHKDTYNQLQKRPGFKFVMLGTPWNGSYMIMQFLTGQGKRFNALNKLTFLEKKEDLLFTVSKFPGVIDLLPKLDENHTHKFHDDTWWKSLRAESKQEHWSIPDDRVLKEWKNYTKKLKDKKLDIENVIYVAGKADNTVNNFSINGEGIKYSGTANGDGSVTWEEGIPTEFKNEEGSSTPFKNVYFVQVGHGELVNDPSLFEGIIDLLRFGKINNKKEFQQTPFTEGSSLTMRSGQTLPKTPIVPNNTEDLWNVLLGGTSSIESDRVEDERVMTVRFTCADLKKSLYPVVVGHQNGSNLKGSEHAANQQMDKKLGYLLELGLYPNAHGSCEVFLTNQKTSFKGVIVVGTGPKDHQSGFQLVRAIEKGILKFAYTVDESNYTDHLIKDKQLKVSSVLISSYYGGLSIEESLQSILKGIKRANQILLENENDLWISEIEFIEIYEDRCDQALLKMIRIKEQDLLDFNINIIDDIDIKEGARLSLPSDHDDDWYKRYSIEAIKRDKEDKDEVENLLQGLTFKVSGGLASENIMKDYTNRHVVEALIKGIPEHTWNPELSKALFELLIPNDFKTNFKRHSNILLVVDKETAKFPWEMLAPDLHETEPLAINTSIIRQFSSEDNKVNPVHVTNKKAFIIGNPDTKDKMPSLPSARVETDKVYSLLQNEKYDCYYEPDPKNVKAQDYIIKLMAHEYKIIHISAHGVYEAKDKISKIILGPDPSDVLTPIDLCKMSYTPELAFINCCHVGTLDTPPDDLIRDRYKIAASIGEQLLNQGYRAVIVAGWAIHDDAARIFAEVFYERFLNGVEFGRAVLEARKACYAKYKNSNTWGAYQCYGDPEYKLVSTPGKASGNSKFYVKKEIKIALRKFRNQITNKRHKDKNWFVDLEDISKKIQESNFAGDPDIQELEAQSYADINEWGRAINLYETLFESGKTGYTFKCYEQYLNIRTRHAYKQAKLNKDKTKNIKEIKTCIRLFENLLDTGNIAERQHLIGSAYKRLFILEPKIEHLKHVALYYKNGLSMCNSDTINKYHYPLINLLKTQFFISGKTSISSQLIRCYCSGSKKQDLIDTLEKGLKTIQNSGNFWNEVAVVSLYQYKLVTASSKDLSKLLSNMKQAFANAWDMTGTFKEKSSELEHVEFLIAGIHRLRLDKQTSKTQKKKLKENLNSLAEFEIFLKGLE